MARARTQTFVGLNIEPGLVAAAQVSVNGSLAICDGGRVELQPDIVRDGEVVDAEAVAEALRALWREHSDLDKRVRIGVANARIVVRTMYLPPISDPGQLATAVRFQAREEIPMPLEEAVLDFHSLGTVETGDGPRQRVVLVAARRDMIETILTTARSAGLKPAGIDLSAFGMVRALTRPGADDGPELFASIGGLTNLAMSDRGVCTFTRVAGGGLEHMAVDLAERCELTLAHARMWLHHVGLERPADAIDGDPTIVAGARAVLADGVRRIAGEVRGSLDFHHAQTDGGRAVERVVLTGPAVAVAGFAPALEAELAIEVQERVVGGAQSMGLDRLAAGCLSVAAGLAVEKGPGA